MTSQTTFFTTLVLIILILLSTTTPSSASPISKRFIPLIQASSIEGSHFTPLLSPSSSAASSQSSNQANIQILSTPAPEYPRNYACVALCDSLGYLRRDERGGIAMHDGDDDDGVVTVSVLGRWITNEEDAEENEDDGVRCDCKQIKLVYDLREYLSTALAQATSTPTTSTNPTATSTYTSTTSSSPQSSSLSGGAITAIILATFFLLLLCILFTWIGVTIYQIITTKRSERQNERQDIEAAAVAIVAEVNDQDNIDPSQKPQQIPPKLTKDVLSFLGTTGTGPDAISESREVLVGPSAAGWRNDDELQRYEEYLEQQGVRVYEDYEVEEGRSRCSSRNSGSEVIEGTRVSQVGMAK